MGNVKEVYEFDNDDLRSIDAESGQSPASGTSASTYRPVHHRPVHHEPAQMHSRQPWPNNIDSQRPSIQFKREEDDNNLGNYMVRFASFHFDLLSVFLVLGLCI